MPSWARRASSLGMACRRRPGPLRIPLHVRQKDGEPRGGKALRQHLQGDRLAGSGGARDEAAAAGHGGQQERVAPLAWASVSGSAMGGSCVSHEGRKQRLQGVWWQSQMMASRAPWWTPKRDGQGPSGARIRLPSRGVSRVSRAPWWRSISPATGCQSRKGHQGRGLVLQPVQMTR